MKLIRGLHNMPDMGASALSIGNFDGVHLGHQRIITKLVNYAKQQQLLTIVMSFKPTPQAFFGKEQAALTSLREKYSLLKQMGVDYLLVVPFNEAFANQSAAAFVTQVLVNKLAVKYCLIGDDFCFGKNRTGDMVYLQQQGARFEFAVKTVDTVNFDNERVSSSALRCLLAAGDFKKAALFLGREFSLSGRVTAGDRRGKQMGFPTININIKRRISPVAGVFAVWVVLDNQTYRAAANVGIRPTVDGKKLQLEVHIFDFEQQVYGRRVEIVFKQKIRDEKKFTSLTALTAQIKQDCQMAQKYFNKLSVN